MSKYDEVVNCYFRPFYGSKHLKQAFRKDKAVIQCVLLDHITASPCYVVLRSSLNTYYTRGDDQNSDMNSECLKILFQFRCFTSTW